MHPPADEAMRDWVTNLSTTHYLVGSAIGPAPFPTIVRDFQSVIGQEIKEQMQAATGKLPDAVVACVGGGSNAIGYVFLPSPVRWYRFLTRWGTQNFPSVRRRQECADYRCRGSGRGYVSVS